MNAIDRKVAKAILKLSGGNYSANMYHSEKSSNLQLDSNSSFIQLKMDPSEIRMSILRLANNGFLILGFKDVNKGLHFSISDKLVHPFVFAIDSFTKKFWDGFITGLAAGIATTLLTLFLTGRL